MRIFFLFVVMSAFSISGCCPVQTNSTANNKPNVVIFPAVVPKISLRTTAGNKEEQIERVSYNYFKIIKEIIYKNWQIPSNLDNQTATIRLNLSRDGEISNIAVNATDENFKNSLMEAVQRSRLPVPPPDCYESFKNISLTFHSK